jgi:hypothetical protein
MATIKITRTGKAPLVFEGELIAKAGGRITAGKEQNRWHEIAIYQTTGGRMVCRISYHTQWEGELEQSEAEEVEVAALAAYLATYDPTAQCQGFPDAPQYEARQARLMAWLRARYEAAVGEILAAVPGAEEEIS